MNKPFKDDDNLKTPTISANMVGLVKPAPDSYGINFHRVTESENKVELKQGEYMPVQKKVEPTPSINNFIKFYPPPDNCDSCWKQRKKFFKSILPNVKFTDNKLVIIIVGDCHDEKKDKLEKFLKSELVKMEKSDVEIIFESV